MRVLWWIIVILSLAAVPGTIAHGWRLLNHGSERDASEFALRVGFCVFLITLGLKFTDKSDDEEK